MFVERRSEKRGPVAIFYFVQGVAALNWSIWTSAMQSRAGVRIETSASTNMPPRRFGHGRSLASILNA